MKVFILGMGNVGKQLASMFKADGHTVVGTTTTEAKVEQLKTLCDNVAVLKGTDKEALHAALGDVDVCIVTAGPNMQQASTPETRQKHYHEVLTVTAQNVCSAPFKGVIVACSSFAVIGDAADGLDIVDETAPYTDSKDASPAEFRAMEETYLKEAGDRALVYRCCDIASPDDMSLIEKVKMMHKYFKGTSMFSPEALFYRLDSRDMINAIKFGIDNKLTGLYHLTHPETPCTNREFGDGVCAKLGLEKMNYASHIQAPAKPISVQKILDAGFKFKYSTPETSHKPAEIAGMMTDAGQFVGENLQQVIEKFDLEYVKGEDGSNVFKVFTSKPPGAPAAFPVGHMLLLAPKDRENSPILKACEVSISVPRIGMDSHMMFVFTKPESLLPHFTIDSVHLEPSKMPGPPQTGDPYFALHIDMINRVDLGQNIDYMNHVYKKVTDFTTNSRKASELTTAHLTPYQLAVMSPWMMAYRSTPAYFNSDVRPIGSGWREHWTRLVQDGLPAGLAKATPAELAKRDLQNRDLLFSPEIDPVWANIDRMVTTEVGARMREILKSQIIETSF